MMVAAGVGYILIVVAAGPGRKLAVAAGAGTYCIDYAIEDDAG